MLTFKELKRRVHDWYLGEYTARYSIDEIGMPGHVVRPWLAKAFDFIIREYKWVIGVLIALFMAYLAYRG